MNAPTDEMHGVAQHGATQAEASLLVAFTRMETKVDVVLTQHGAKLEDHETRLRVVEDRPSASPTELADHDLRLRSVEGRATVSPRALWTGLIGASGVIVGALTFLDKLYRPGG